ncbi:synaptobrevin homolog YKT6 [Clonorchis sinensis]|uniref:Synaptobrevin homolog YKT6 n=1 Tax=Clonorchis sinensis TaxID=79923 RepID=H2KTY8_CLOSI|nr:synaptobrevin homolog YKT6 [Clonorchis sinensis]
MKLFSLQILFKTGDQCKLLQASHELSTFRYFHRSSVKEFMVFTGKLVGEKTERCQRGLVKEQGTFFIIVINLGYIVEYICHVFVRHDNLCGVLIADQEYPQRVAQTLLTKATEDFAAEYPSNTWAMMAEESAACKKIDEYLQRYQNPVEADGLMRLHNELDETKVILHNTLESLLARGEKLDDLVQRSEDLSVQSKMFYTTLQPLYDKYTVLTADNDDDDDSNDRVIIALRFIFTSLQFNLSAITMYYGPTGSSCHSFDHRKADEFETCSQTLEAMACSVTSANVFRFERCDWCARLIERLPSNCPGCADRLTRQLGLSSQRHETDLDFVIVCIFDLNPLRLSAPPNVTSYRVEAISTVNADLPLIRSRSVSNATTYSRFIAVHITLIYSPSDFQFLPDQVSALWQQFRPPTAVNYTDKVALPHRLSRGRYTSHHARIMHIPSSELFRGVYRNAGSLEHVIYGIDRHFEAIDGSDKHCDFA